MEFSREAGSAKIALFSALEDVKRAVPGAKLIEAAPDFVSLTDVAVLTKQINLANAAPMLQPAIQREMQALLA